MSRPMTHTMTRTMTHTRFSGVQRLLHWTMAAGIVAMLFIGVGMLSTIAPSYVPLVATHKTLGIALLALVFVRLVLRLVLGAPPLPASLPPMMRLGAILSHWALYGLMIAMPLLGWAMMSAAAHPIVLFGGLRLPSILPQGDQLHTLLWAAHRWLAFAFFGLILLHVAAALFHALIRRDGVFEAMSPLPFGKTERRG